MTGRHLLASASLLLAQAVPALASTPPCRLRVGVAVGCVGNGEAEAQRAADFFAVYRFDKAKMLRPSTKDYLARFGCLRLIEQGGPLGLAYHGFIPVATEAGTVGVRWLSAISPAGNRFILVADPYFVGPCRRWSDADYAAEQARAAR